jgi:hypothetical protein
MTDVETLINNKIDAVNAEDRLKSGGRCVKIEKMNLFV